MEELKEEFKVLDKKCAEKHNIALDLIPEIKKADNTFDKNNDVKCFIHCILEEKKLFNGNKYDSEVADKLVEDAPAEIKEFSKTALAKCKNSSAGIEDKCEAAYVHHKCVGIPPGLKTN